MGNWETRDTEVSWDMVSGYMGNRETGYTEIQRYMETGKQDTGNT